MMAMVVVIMVLDQGAGLGLSELPSRIRCVYTQPKARKERPCTVGRRRFCGEKGGFVWVSLFAWLRAGCDM